VRDLILTDIHKRFGDRDVLAGLDLRVPGGSFTALLGPSGVGKTTLLRLLAGFDTPDHGTIAVGERILSGGSVHVPPERRRIGYVPQEGSLFPHLTVAANIGFGLPRRERADRVGELLELVDLVGLDARFPHQISGGQQQRVALARALAVRPEVVLLDEPFASLDAQLRAGVRDDVRRILASADTTTLLVTHNQDEALSSADLVAVLRHGTIVQHASPRELYGLPADGELASFVGDANLLVGTLQDRIVQTPLGRLKARPRAGDDDDQGNVQSQVRVLIRPEQITLTSPGSGSELSGHIVSCDYHGHDSVVTVHVDSGGVDETMVVRTASATALVAGQPVELTLTGPVQVWPLTPASGKRAPAVRGLR
jgi:iron(III) transport system ATP-binding protein